MLDKRAVYHHVTKLDSQSYSSNNKNQLSLTNRHDALRHGKRGANKGGRSV